jgi:hypothetical protein
MTKKEFYEIDLEGNYNILISLKRKYDLVLESESFSQYKTKEQRLQNKGNKTNKNKLNNINNLEKQNGVLKNKNDKFKFNRLFFSNTQKFLKKFINNLK